jgi:hypothetical protein
MTGVAYLAVEATTGIIAETRAVDTSSGAGDATKIPALDASGKLAVGFMPSGFGTDTVTVTASEALSAGDFVNLWNSSGIKARKADNTTAGKEAHGYVLAGVSNGAAATVYMSGENTSVTGLTVGARQFLAATGGHTETAPTTAGQVLQIIGVATSATALSFAPSTPITRA